VRQRPGYIFSDHRTNKDILELPTFYPMGTRDCFPGGKISWAWSWQLISI